MSEKNLKNSATELISICVIGLSGCEQLKGSIGVGKSLICNRFVRGDYDRFRTEHSSILSQADFRGSPVINSDHWIYWGVGYLNNNDGSSVQIKLIEQTEFVDDETFEPFEGSSNDYPKRATKIKLDSPDKLMYICREQLGLETEYEHVVLPEGRAQIDGFIFVYDISITEGRTFDQQSNIAAEILYNALKTKKPIVIAASKADIGTETGKKALQRLLSRKEFKSSSINVVEVSSIANVNITALFALVAAFVTKNKIKPKVLSFSDALKIGRRIEEEISDQYVALLRELMPVERWPQVRPSWTRLINRIGLARHPTYQNFVYHFGRSEAMKFYQKHVNEAREYWMQRRLKVQVPRLHHVFHDLIGIEQVRSLSWAEAKDIISNHPLFDDYFQPLGTLSADLDPSSPQVELDPNDSRIPAEILLATEAEPTFFHFQEAVDLEYQRELMEEAYEQMLSQCPQVTPGKPLQEVEIFLRDNPVYNAVPIQQALRIYDKYQDILVKKAEKDFAELLLERLQIFLDIILRRIKSSQAVRPLIGIDEDEINGLRVILNDDFRYRQLNRLFEMRDKMISNYISFVSYPLVQNCPAANQCIGALLSDIFSNHLQRLQLVDSSQILNINLTVVGAERLSNDFISAVSRMVQNDVLEYEGRLAHIICKTELQLDGVNHAPIQTYVYLIDSIDALEDIKGRSLNAAQFQCPPLVVLVIDPTHLDIIPFLRQQASLVANSIAGTFVAPMSDLTTKPRQSSDNELNTFFTRDQISRVLEAAFLSQTDERRADLRIQLSLMCGDQFPAHFLLNSLFFNAAFCTTSSSDDTITIEVPIQSFKRKVRIDLRVTAYHSWLVSGISIPIHGHILAYSARRRASFSHAKAAAKRLISTSFATGDTILLAAVADVTDFFSDTEANALLTEGSELAEELKSSFISLSPEIPDRIHSITFLEFFERILTIHSSKNFPFFSTYYSNYPLLYSEMNNANFHGLSTPSWHTSTVQSNCTTTSYDSSSSRSSCHPNSFHSRSDIPSSTHQGKCGSERVFLKRNASKLSSPNEILSSGLLTINLRKGKQKNGHASSRAMNNGRTYPIPPPTICYSAPLATPEYIEIANEYITVKDAVAFENNESIYETLNFSAKNSVSLQEINIIPHKGDLYEKKQTIQAVTNKKMSLPNEEKSLDTVIRNRQPIENGEALKNAVCVPHLAKPMNDKRIWHIPLPLISPATTICRVHSISAESLIDVGLINSSNYYGHIEEDALPVSSVKKQHLKARFVRKMASSFRFRKGFRITDEVDEECASDDCVEVVSENGSRSVPHSPRTERLALSLTKRREPPFSSEKISNAFSWLATRSPKRNHRCNVPEIVANIRMNGVLSQSDTLQSLASRSDDGIPFFVKKCIEYIEKEGGLSIEGLYRVPGNQAQVIEFERLFINDSSVDLHSMEMPVHAVATALKNFLSGLPDPIIPYDAHEALVNCISENSPEGISLIKDVINSLPDANRKTLSYLAAHLARVAKCSNTNSMDVRNLAKVWWPTLFRPNFDSFESMAIFITRLEMATQLLILYANIAAQ